MVLFIDEADSFLRKRGVEGDNMMTESLRNALSTFLFRSGTPSDKFMLVLATNEPAVRPGAPTARSPFSRLTRRPASTPRRLTAR